MGLSSSSPNLAEAERHYHRATALMGSQFMLSTVGRVTRHLKQAVRAAPSFGEAHLLLGHAYEYKAHRRMGFRWWLRRKARQHFRLAVQHLSPGTSSHTRACLALAGELAWGGQAQEVQALVTALTRDPDVWTRMRAFTLLGVASFRRKRIPDAIAHWRAGHGHMPADAVNFEPSLPGAWLRRAYRRLARKALRQRQFAVAVRHYEEVIALGNLFLDGSDYRALAHAYALAGQRDKVSHALDEAAALDREVYGEERMPEYREEIIRTLPEWAYAYDRDITPEVYQSGDDRKK